VAVTIQGASYVLERLQMEIEGDLHRLGLFYRIFTRAKSLDAVRQKIDRKNYSETGRTVTDLLGVRVVVYFADDAEIVDALLQRRFVENDRAVDDHGENVFGPTRFNATYHIPERLASYLHLPEAGKLIAKTFEVQLRTVLSEGWHEVEHDLRYKASEDWNGQDDLRRALNGILATVETCDWSMKRLFNELAHRHYKAGRWEAMVRHKFRLRISGSMSQEVGQLIGSRRRLARELFRTDRLGLLHSILENDIELPLTMDNVCFLANWFAVRDQELSALAPHLLEVLPEA
jgi:putative GTP pyrophosphokinase